MKILVRRFLWDEDETISIVYVDGVRFCIGIEDAIRETKIWGETAIPDGTYNMGLRWSNKFSTRFGHKMLWVLDVPNFEYIYIHPGNTADDTHGCFLVGKSLSVVKGRVAVTASKLTYDNLYKKVIAAVEKNECTLTFEMIDKPKTIA
jgi:hypothetical protein